MDRCIIKKRASIIRKAINLSNLKTGKVRAIRFLTLDVICKTLNCQPGEILEYVCKNEDDEDI